MIPNKILRANIAPKKKRESMLKIKISKEEKNCDNYLRWKETLIDKVSVMRQINRNNLKRNIIFIVIAFPSELK